MTDIILNTTSSEHELKAYFEAVCKIADSNSDEFPINLDEVWPLAYAEKGKAVRALKDGFIENVDYKSITTNGKTDTGGYRVTNYFISTSCLEYLIARKHREVFEIYRRVFHAARKGELMPITSPDNPQLQFVQTQLYLADALADRLRLNDASRLGMYQSIAEPYRLAIPQYVPSQGVMKSASVLLKEIGSDISAIKFNQLLEAHGYVETITRPSTGGKTRKFKNVTDKGKAYGENEVNPKNQKETQPHWYVDSFRELYNMVTA